MCFYVFANVIAPAASSGRCFNNITGAHLFWPTGFIFHEMYASAFLPAPRHRKWPCCRMPAAAATSAMAAWRPPQCLRIRFTMRQTAYRRLAAAVAISSRMICHSHDLQNETGRVPDNGWHDFFDDECVFLYFVWTHTKYTRMHFSL
jgi:hypothetical protein